MLINYIKTAFRNILRQKLYSIINIIGLSIGMACCLLILMWVADELSFDKSHTRSDRIFRIAEQVLYNGTDPTHYPVIGPGIGPAVKSEFPDKVEEAVRMFDASAATVTIDQKKFRGDKKFTVDPGFFKIFDHQFIAGNADTALSKAGSAVLTESSAVKFFGKKDAVRKIIRIENMQIPDVEITGVIRDVPANSHMEFDMLISLEGMENETNTDFFRMWVANICYTYLLLKDSRAETELESAFPGLIEKYVDAEGKKWLKGLYLQPLTSIHLHSQLLAEIKPNGSINHVYIFSAIAFLTLFIACMNFMNLATARSSKRAKEIGLRKSIGASRNQIIAQFLAESILISFISLPIALGICELLLPLFNSLSGKNLSAAHFFTDINYILGLVCFTAVVGIFSGSYTSFYLSSFEPIGVLSGRMRLSGGGAGFRKILVFVQFSISIALMICIAVILRQLDFINTKDLGFSKTNVIVIPAMLPDGDGFREAKLEILKNTYSGNKNILAVTRASSLPGQLRNVTTVFVEDDPGKGGASIAEVSVDCDYLKSLGIKLKEGRFFSPDFSTDNENAFIINETAAKALGLESPVGRRLIMRYGIGGEAAENERRGEIVGVIEDMNYEPLKRCTFPMLFTMNPGIYFNIALSITGTDTEETIRFLKSGWENTLPGYEFQYSFLEDDINTLYASDYRLAEIILSFAILAVFIACLGLFGLVSYAAEQRRKEIAIRKTLGASITGAVILLVKELTGIVLLSNILAWGTAYWMMSAWMESFKFHAGLSIWSFILPSVLAATIAFSTVSVQAVRAAIDDPIKALKYE